jgi:hypothetical protein
VPRAEKGELTQAIADSFLVIAHGTAEEVARAKAILGTAKASRLDGHAGMNAAEKTDQLVHTGG